MGVSKPVLIGTRDFKKQGDALAFFREILWRYDVGSRLSDNDAVDVEALLARHQDSEKKVGAGVDHFVIMISDEGSRCFGAVRRDGSRVGFSYKRCVTQRW